MQLNINFVILKKSLINIDFLEAFMDLAPHKSINLIKNIKRDFDKLFEKWKIFPSRDKHFFPKVDIKEEPSKFIVRAEIPGIDPKNIQISLKNDNTLAIKGRAENESHHEKEDFLSIERFWGDFYREFPLSSNIKAEEIYANAKRGILEIIVPKTETDKTEKPIEIKIEEPVEG